ncbi:MAG: MotA/TolQ/ExbB proton channel family protein [Verrucomicrobiota bacterium]
MADFLLLASFVDFFDKGGFFMWPLALCSVISIAIIMERAWALRRAAIMKGSLSRAILELHYGDSTTVVEELSADENTVLSRLVRSCLLYTPWSKAENSEAVQTKARSEIAHMERGLVVLEIIVGIAPLLGLLGTVWGLTLVFANAGEGSQLAEQGVMIARGISEALYTTVAGMVVAIPSLIAHSYFTRRIEGYSVELESICQDLLGKLYSDAAPPPPATPVATPPYAEGGAAR